MLAVLPPSNARKRVRLVFNDIFTSDQAYDLLFHQTFSKIEHTEGNVA